MAATRFGRELLPPALLALATAAFCWKLLFGGLVVIGYDTMTYMYAYRHFAAAAVREGRLPLWNPQIFYGVPFLANLQSAVFYPLHALFLVLPTTWGMNASVALHLFLAAYFAYLAARHLLAVDRLSAGVAGMIYGLGGFVGSQVGHLNQLNAAAWLPLALLTLHQALVRRSVRWVAATAAVLGVQLLAGHAQESFMTVVLLAAYAGYRVLWRAIGAAGELARSPAPPGAAVPSPAAGAPPPERPQWLAVAGRGWGAGWREAAWAAVALGLAGGLAAGAAAVQLLPTNQLTGLSIRAGGMTFGEATSFSLPPRELLVGLLPTFGLASPTSNEYLGWIGFGGLALALLGALFRLQRPNVGFFFAAALVTLLLALGNHFPLYRWAFHAPGMDLFRVPARWLLLTSLCAAMLAGSGLAFLRQLSARGWTEAPATTLPAGPWQRLLAASRLLLGFLVVSIVAAAIWPFQRPGPGTLPATLTGLWLALAGAAASLSFWSLAASPSRWPPLVLAAGVLGELFLASRSLEYNNPNPPGVYTDSRPVLDALREVTRPDTRIVSTASTGYHPADAGELVQGHQHLLGERGVLATLINTKYKETLNPNLSMVFGIPTVDGYDGGVLPLRRYVEYKRLVVPPENSQADGLLRDQLKHLPPAAHLRALGADFVLTDAIGDVTRDGVAYDLSHTVTLASDQARRFDLSRPGAPHAVRSVGLVTSLEGAQALPQGAPVAAITLGRTAGAERQTLWQGHLIAGRHTAEGTYSAGVRHAQPPPLGPTAAGGSATATYLATVDLPAGIEVDWVGVQSMLSATDVRLRLHALSLAAAPATAPAPGSTQSTAPGPARAPASVTSVTLAPDLTLIHRSDVKLYRNERPLPRAYVAPDAVVVDDLERALAVLRREGHDPQRLAVLERSAPASPAAGGWRGHLRRLRDAVYAAAGIERDAHAGTVDAPETLPRAAGAEGAATVRWLESAAERLTLEVDAPSAGLLVVRDTFYPGWSARVDGREVPILRADVLFRAIPIEAGSHRVELSFRSRPLERGALVSLLSIAATAALLLVPARWVAQWVARWVPVRRPATPPEGVAAW